MLPPHAPHVAVVVLNWNGWADTIASAESILRSDHAALSITICDNASVDDSVERIRAWGRTINSIFPKFAFVDRSGAVKRAGEERIKDLCGTVTLLQAGSNGGYAAGNNVGIRAALKDLSVSAVWILNNDVIIEPTALNEALQVLSSDETIGLVGSTLCYMDDPQRIQCQGGGRFDRRKGLAETIGAGESTSRPIPADDVIAEMDFVNGAAVLVSRRLLETVGLMSEDYFLYWEELDWAYRLRPQFRLGYAPRAKILHKVGASIGTKDGGEGSPLSEYFYNRNRIRFCQRHSRESLPYVYTQLCWNVLQALLRRRPQRALLLTRAIMGLPGPMHQ